jgi:hypothetical protein
MLLKVTQKNNLILRKRGREMLEMLGILGKWGLLDGSKRDYVFFKILKNEASATEPNLLFKCENLQT